LDRIPKKTLEKLLLMAQEVSSDKNKWMGRMEREIEQAKRIGGGR